MLPSALYTIGKSDSWTFCRVFTIAFVPYCLFLDVLVAGGEQLYEDGHRARVDHYPGLVRVAAGDVGQGPGSLELEGALVSAAAAVASEKLHEPGGKIQGEPRKKL